MGISESTARDGSGQSCSSRPAVGEAEMGREVSRRQFVAATTSAGVGPALNEVTRAAEEPAVLGRRPICARGYQSWAMVDAADQEAVWFMQNMLLGPRSDIDQIAEAIGKIPSHAPAVARV